MTDASDLIALDLRLDLFDVKVVFEVVCSHDFPWCTQHWDFPSVVSIILTLIIIYVKF